MVAAVTRAVHPPEAAPEVVKTHCPYCAFQCGMTLQPVEVEEPASPASARPSPSSARVPLRVLADPDFPVNRGQMCIKGFTSADLLDHPERLRTPLVRDARGRLVPATWDEALDRVASTLAQTRATYGAAAVGLFGSGALTNEKTYLLGKFARVVLGTPNIDYNGRYCMASGAGGQNKTVGLDRGLPFPVADIAETETLLLWGSNCADTMPPMMQWVSAQRERGGASIVVDPRRTETARNATLHLPITPGTDLALANGLLHLAILEGLVEQAYVKARTVGFEAVRRAAMALDPAEVERITGIPLEHQLRVVHLLGDAASSMILTGRGAEQQSKGTDTVIALVNLMLALGKVGKPYSGYGCVTGQGNGQGGREHGQKADQLPGYRLIEDPEHRARVAKHWGVDPASLPGKGKSAFELLDALGPARASRDGTTAGGIRALFVMGSNVAVASPDADRIVARLRALDFLVVCDSFLNETSEHAHVVLPIAQWAEEEGTMTNLEGRVILRTPARAMPPGVRGDLEILASLSERLGKGEGMRFPSSEAVFDELARVTAGAKADYSGITYAKLREAQGIHWPCPAKEHPGTPRLFAERFPWPDGKARMLVVPYRPAAEVPDAEYPLYFTTGRYREHYNSGAQTRQVGALVSAQPEPKVQIHPRLAQQLEVVDGDPLLVESRRGAITFTVAVMPEIRPDTLFAPFHWGGRRAANVLTIAALDPTSRMPEFKVCAVRARRSEAPGATGEAAS